MRLPIFTPAPARTIQRGKLEFIDYANEPRCRCGEGGPLDETLGVCVCCWRIVVIVRQLLSERDASPLMVVTSPSPVADIELARARRDGTPPSIATHADAAGISLDVNLGAPPRPRKP